MTSAPASDAGGHAIGRVAFCCMLALALRPAGLRAEPGPRTGAEVSVVGTALEVEAERLEADLAGGEVEAWRVRLTACGGCEAPYSLSARHARIRPGGDIDLLLPVLRVGPVPVAALPWLRVRTGRRPGLLLPRLGLRSGGGLEVGQGAWFPLGATASLAVHAAWLSELRGAELEARLEGDRTRLDALVHAGVETVSARVVGQAHGRVGASWVAAAVDWTYGGEQARRLARTVEEEARTFAVSRVALARAADTLQLSLAAGLANDLWLEPERSVPLSEVGLDLLGTGSGPLWVSGRVSHRVLWLVGSDRWPAFRTSAEPVVRLQGRLGPLLARATGTALLVSWPRAVEVEDRGGAPAGRALLAVGADLSAPIWKPLPGGLRHDLEPSLTYRLVALDVTSGLAVEPPGADRLAWPAVGHLLALSLRSGLRSPVSGRGLAARATGLVGLPGGAGAALEPRLDLGLALEATVARVELEASVGAEAIGEARVSASLDLSRRVSLSLAWRFRGWGPGSTFGPEPRADVPLLVPWGGETAHALASSLSVSPHREWRLEGGVALDLESGTVVTGGGGLAYRNRCGCLGAGLQIWHRYGRSWPDVLVVADLGGLGAR